MSCAGCQAAGGVSLVLDCGAWGVGRVDFLGGWGGVVLLAPSSRSCRKYGVMNEAPHDWATRRMDMAAKDGYWLGRSAA